MGRAFKILTCYTYGLTMDAKLREMSMTAWRHWGAMYANLELWGSAEDRQR